MRLVVQPLEALVAGLSSGDRPRDGGIEGQHGSRLRESRRDELTPELDAAAHARDVAALARDVAALARDHVAALQDGELAARDARRGHGQQRAVTGAEIVIRAADERRRAAADRVTAGESRARAAADRAHAARDRELAARDRLRAQADREALRAALALAQAGTLSAARTRTTGPARLEHDSERAPRTSAAERIARADRELVEGQRSRR